MEKNAPQDEEARHSISEEEFLELQKYNTQRQQVVETQVAKKVATAAATALPPQTTAPPTASPSTLASALESVPQMASATTLPPTASTTTLLPTASTTTLPPTASATALESVPPTASATTLPPTTSATALESVPPTALATTLSPTASATTLESVPPTASATTLPLMASATASAVTALPSLKVHLDTPKPFSSTPATRVDLDPKGLPLDNPSHAHEEIYVKEEGQDDSIPSRRRQETPLRARYEKKRGRENNDDSEKEENDNTPLPLLAPRRKRRRRYEETIAANNMMMLPYNVGGYTSSTGGFSQPPRYLPSFQNNALPVFVSHPQEQQYLYQQQQQYYQQQQQQYLQQQHQQQQQQQQQQLYHLPSLHQAQPTRPPFGSLSSLPATTTTQPAPISSSANAPLVKTEGGNQPLLASLHPATAKSSPFSPSLQQLPAEVAQALEIVGNEQVDAMAKKELVKLIKPFLQKRDGKTVKAAKQVLLDFLNKHESICALDITTTTAAPRDGLGTTEISYGQCRRQKTEGTKPTTLAHVEETLFEFAKSKSQEEDLSPELEQYLSEMAVYLIDSLKKPPGWRLEISVQDNEIVRQRTGLFCSGLFETLTNSSATAATATTATTRR